MNFTLPPISSVVQLKRKNAGESAGACPKCGGVDRFIVWDTGKFWCRQCEWNGDQSDFFQHHRGVDFKGLSDLYSNHAVKWREVSKYTYRNEEGAILFRVKKLTDGNGKKKFIPERKTETGWETGIKGHVDPVPYNLPAVIKSDTVFIVEGEKDVDTLTTYGFTASCNAGGAKKWKSEYNHWFSEKDIIILPDNDVPGKDHALQVARNLSAHAKSVKIVSLPVKSKEDVTDWIDEGHTREELISIVSESKFFGASGALETNGALGALCAFGALGVFGAENISWCKDLFFLVYDERARVYKEKSKEYLEKDNLISFMNDFDGFDFINNEQKQALIKLGALGALSGRFGALLVRFGALLRNDDQLIEKTREWIQEASGMFTNGQIYQDLGIANPQDKKRVRSEMSRMVKNLIIEKGDKNGQYRKVDSETTAMDFVNAVDDTLPIFWPLGIGEHAKIMPGNIVVVAGTTNAGKTGFLLNVVNDNQHDFDIHYFSSEMGPSEMKSRLKMFDRPITDWHFKAYERTDDFHDVIRPGHRKINIIDYIEISEDYWKIAGMIRKIYDKLDGAIAIIALQKNAGAEYGDGGMKSAQKARLYLSMSPNQIKFTKVKAFVDPSDNPNGKVLNYKLRSGCHFSVDRDWHYQEAKKS